MAPRWPGMPMMCLAAMFVCATSFQSKAENMNQEQATVKEDAAPVKALRGVMPVLIEQHGVDPMKYRFELERRGKEWIVTAEPVPHVIGGIMIALVDGTGKVQVTSIY